jgi:response regulator RpfG family c-di-GMP phosphodiesterase
LTPTEPGRDQDRPCVLIVDDEVRILNALKRTLRREGYEILLADSPGEALRVLEERDVDLVLTDHKMPGMTGIELLAEAARLRPDAARLMITGWAGEVPRDQISALDVKVLIPKPWDDGELKAALASHLLS